MRRCRSSASVPIMVVQATVQLVEKTVSNMGGEQVIARLVEIASKKDAGFRVALFVFCRFGVIGGAEFAAI